MTVTSPLRQDCFKNTLEDANYALHKASDAKTRKCHALCASKGLSFVPLPVTTFGAWSADAASHIKDIARLQAANSGRSSSVTVKHVFQRLAVCLQRGNGNLLFSRSPNPDVAPHVDGFH